MQTGSKTKSAAIPLLILFIAVAAVLCYLFFFADSEKKACETQSSYTTEHTASDVSKTSETPGEMITETAKSNGETTEASSGTENGTTDAETETTSTEAVMPSYLTGLKIGSDYFIGYDKTNDAVLFEKNADKKCYPASVTKIITAVIAIENMPLDAKVKVGKECAQIPAGSSVAEIKAGQVFTLKDILYGLLLPSGNDAANTIAVNTARYLYGSELGITEATNRFMDLCNEKLKEIGATATHFSCPYGAAHSDHYTTVRDILKLSVYAMENPVFAEIVKTVSITVTAVSGETFKWKNTNYLLKPTDSRYYEYTTGIKNGYSANALYCVSASANKDGRELYAVAFHAVESTTRYADAKRFFETAYAAFPAKQPVTADTTDIPGITEETGLSE